MTGYFKPPLWGWFVVQQSMTTTVAGASQAVENLPANAGGMRHRFGPWEDPLEEG